MKNYFTAKVSLVFLRISYNSFWSCFPTLSTPPRFISSSLPTQICVLVSFLTHQVQFVLLVYDWICGLDCWVVNLPRTAFLKRLCLSQQVDNDFHKRRQYTRYFPHSEHQKIHWDRRLEPNCTFWHRLEEKEDPGVFPVPRLWWDAGTLTTSALQGFALRSLN